MHVTEIDDEKMVARVDSFLRKVQRPPIRHAGTFIHPQLPTIQARCVAFSAPSPMPISFVEFCVLLFQNHAALARNYLQGLWFV